jgi:cellulose synthase/poly-beta-1,6-N-acetylglucosamine synthase-like glycosyltransferase
MAKIFFWVAILLLAHTYVFYPLLLIAWEAAERALGNARALRGGAPLREPSAHDFVPRVTLLVAAYNEERCIADKIRNALSADYPQDRLEVIVGSDGSSDATDAIVRARCEPRVRLCSARRAGKSSVLNRCIPSASGEIIVLSDANTRVAPDAIRKLVRHFASPEVGAVCGCLRLSSPRRAGYEEGAYWTYESLIKLYEGKRGAVMGANGGLYAIRRSLFQALPPSTIVDDFVLPLRILERGYQVRYEPEAVAREETTEDYRREFARRARIAAGNFQSLGVLRRLLSPWAGFPAFAFWSHKVLRWMAPALMLMTLVANVFLAARPFYAATLGAQVAFYGLALAGGRRAFAGVPRRAASAAYYFVVMNAAIALGFWRFVWGSQNPAWERTARA